MKIFAKRKRKVAATAGTSVVSSKDRTAFASDPVVEELLKKDPKEWNSKERRMIKRYQERKVESQEEGDVDVDDNSKKVEKGSDGVVQEETDKGVDNGDSMESDESGGDGESDPESEKETRNKETPNSAVPIATKVDPNKDDFANTSEQMVPNGDGDDEAGDDDDGKVDPEHEVYKILDKLNSKMKRTLSRRLEREGIKALVEVQTEAQKILGEDSSSKSKKRGSDDVEKESSTNDDDQKSKKKQKKETNLSDLSPEERLRREEQRQKQKEAAERRARGEDKTPGFKHPLNSERRRANRRKSKWKKGTPSPGTKPVKNEHNHSGFLHRKKAT